MRFMIADADISAAAALLADATRAELLVALAEEPSLQVSRLASRAKVTSATASVHLSKLRRAGLVKAQRRGRQHLFELASPLVAEAMEALSLIAPPRAVRSLKESIHGAAILEARTCYDHLAGRLGVAVADGLEHERIVEVRDGSYLLATRGERALTDLGIDVSELRRGRRQLIRPCLDWTERRHHIAGALGAALAERFFALGWIQRIPGGRAVKVTSRGTRELRRRFNVIHPPGN
jgi:DNA-binding transcriptional ArsR family regulator